MFNYIFYSEQDPQSRKLCIYHWFEIGAINIEVSFVVPTYHIYKVFYDDAYTALGVIILKKKHSNQNRKVQQKNAFGNSFAIRCVKR